MLWDYIFDFFVRHVFGGVSPLDGSYYYANIGTTAELSLLDLETSLFNNTLDISSYLCLIATIVTIVIIVVLCCLFIKKIVSLVGGLIRQ